MRITSILQKGLLLAMSAAAWGQVHLTSPPNATLSFVPGPGTPQVAKVEAQRPNFAVIHSLSVVLRNNGSTNMTGISIHWSWVDSQGNPHTDNQRSDSYFTTTQPVLPPGGSLILYPGIVMWDQNTPHTSGFGGIPDDLATKFAAATQLSATLDAAIMADGTLIGPDQYGFVQYLQDRKNVAGEIADIINANPQGFTNALQAYMKAVPTAATTGRARWSQRLGNDALRSRNPQALANMYLNLPTINVKN